MKCIITSTNYTVEGCENCKENGIICDLIEALEAVPTVRKNRKKTRRRKPEHTNVTSPLYESGGAVADSTHQLPVMSQMPPGLGQVYVPASQPMHPVQSYPQLQSPVYPQQQYQQQQQPQQQQPQQPQQPFHAFAHAQRPQGHSHIQEHGAHSQYVTPMTLVSSAPAPPALIPTTVPPMVPAQYGYAPVEEVAPTYYAYYDNAEQDTSSQAYDQLHATSEYLDSKHQY